MRLLPIISRNRSTHFAIVEIFMKAQVMSKKMLLSVILAATLGGCAYGGNGPLAYGDAHGDDGGMYLGYGYGPDNSRDHGTYRHDHDVHHDFAGHPRGNWSGSAAHAGVAGHAGGGHGGGGSGGGGTR
jgi:hypothetical protein